MRCEHCKAEGQLGVLCAACETTAVVEILEMFVQDWENGSRGHHYEIERRLRELAGLTGRAV